MDLTFITDWNWDQAWSKRTRQCSAQKQTTAHPWGPGKSHQPLLNSYWHITTSSKGAPGLSPLNWFKWLITFPVSGSLRVKNPTIEPIFCYLFANKLCNFLRLQLPFPPPCQNFPLPTSGLVPPLLRCALMYLMNGYCYPNFTKERDPRI